MFIHLEDSNDFENLIKGDEVLVDFFATWCGPCKMLTPELEDLCEEHEEITVVKIDVDKFPLLASKFNIRAVPTLIVFKKGENKKVTQGYMDKDALLALIKNA